jgi:uracil-DNA glycosylase family 4
MIDCSKCQLCYLSKICTPIISIHGNEPKVFGIDYKPGSEEQVTERAWFGRTGQLGIKLLTERFDRKELYLTYLVKCCVGLTKNKEIELCKTSWLLKEIEEIKPSFILLFGKQLFDKLYKDYHNFLLD